MPNAESKSKQQGKRQQGQKSSNSRPQKSANHNYNGKQRKSTNSPSNRRNGNSKSSVNSESQCNPRSSDNDISWYNNNEQLLKDTASFPFTAGTGYPVEGTKELVYAFTENYPAVQKPCRVISVPGIMALNVTTGIGNSYDMNSPVNIAAKRIFYQIRSKVTKSTGYEPADVMMYILAVDQVLSLWAWLVRCYGVVNTFVQQNRYMGDTLLKAMQMEPNGLRQNLANFRTRLNSISAQLNQFFVPKEMTIFQRHMWLFTNLYLDEPHPKSQMYFFNPSGFWEYSPKTSQTGGEMQFVPWGNPLGPADWSDYIALLQSMVDKISLDDDIGDIGGDLAQAFPSSELVSIPSIPEDYILYPEYNPEVLDQIHNAIPVGLTKVDPVDPDLNTRIYQEGGLVKSQYVITNVNDLTEFANTAILNYAEGEVTPARNMIATRLMHLGFAPTTDPANWYALCFVSDMLNSIEVYAFGQERLTTSPDTWGPIELIHRRDFSGYAENDTTMINLYTRFRNRPNYITKRGDYFVDRRNLCNIAQLSVEQLNNTNTTALFGLFGIPANGKIG